MEKILWAGNIALDRAGDLPSDKTHRKEGVLVMVEVEYKNSRPWWGVYPDYKDVSYVLRIKQVANSTYKETDVTYKAGTEINLFVSKSMYWVFTENLLANTDGVLRPHSHIRMLSVRQPATF